MEDLKALVERLCSLNDENLAQEVIDNNNVQNCLIELRDMLANGWISVEERLPDVNKSASDHEEVTVIATDDESVHPMIYERTCLERKNKYRWKWIWREIYVGNPITYWMPLPKLPKEKRKWTIKSLCH